MRYLIVDFPARPLKRHETPCDRCHGAGVVERFAPEQRVLDVDTVLLVQVLCPWCAGCGLAGPHDRRCEGTHGAMPLDHAYRDDPDECAWFRELIIGAPRTFDHDAYTVPRERLNGQASKMRATAYATRLDKQRCWLCAGIGWLPRTLANRAAHEDLEAFVGNVLVYDDEAGPDRFTLAYPCPCAMSRAREVDRPTGY